MWDTGGSEREDLAVSCSSALAANGSRYVVKLVPVSRRFSIPRTSAPVDTIARTRRHKQTQPPETSNPASEPAVAPVDAKMKYEDKFKTISSFLERCQKETFSLPENHFDAMLEVTAALKKSHGKEDEAMALLKKRFAAGKKRYHPESKDYNDHEEMPAHKRTRLLESVRVLDALVPENQKLVDAFTKYAEDQLEMGHTGKFASHIRAAHSIRDHDKPIRSGWEAREVENVGSKMAGQIEEVLRTGKFKDKTANMNMSSDHEYHAPRLVHAVRDSPARRRENQHIVDALADFAEYHLKYGNTGKGTSHLRAAEQIHNTNIVVDSGFRAATEIGYIGDHIAEKIDQILKHGKILYDEDPTAPHRMSGEPAPIVVDLLYYPARRHENQKIVDGLRAYGDSHLRGGFRSKGVSYLRAAVEIRNSNHAITSAEDAKKIPMVGERVAEKVQQILDHGHTDSDEEFEEEDEEEEVDEAVREEMKHEKYGMAHKPDHLTPLVNDIRIHKANCPENQPIVDELAEYGTKLLNEKKTRKGVTFLRAARQLQVLREPIKSGQHAKSVGMIGDKMAEFIERTLKKI